MKKIIVLFVFISSLSYAQQQTVNGDFREPFEICFNNNTGKNVFVAVRYKTIGGVWKTKYWFKYRPYEKNTKNGKYAVKTYNRYVYYYARTKKGYNGYSEWRGSDNYKVVDGKRVGMKEIYLSKSRFKAPRGQRYTINLNY